MRSLLAHPGIEPGTLRSQVGHSNHYFTAPNLLPPTISKVKKLEDH